jgi:hypothetical protein
MLTMKLRTAQKELTDTRAEEASFDEPSARAELRARLAPLEAERLAALNEALATAQTEGTTAVDAARRRAAELVADARAESESKTAPIVVPVPPPAANQPVVIDTTSRDDSFGGDVAWADETAQVPVGPVAAAAFVAGSSAHTEPETAPGATSIAAEPIDIESMPSVESVAESTPASAEPAAAVPAMSNVVLDAETFARVFATVIAETIEKTRAESQSQGWVQPPGAPYAGGIPTGMPYGQYPYYPPAPPKKDGFWSHARHPDVILLSIATVIVLVIMVAWLS